MFILKFFSIFKSIKSYINKNPKIMWGIILLIIIAGAFIAGRVTRPILNKTEETRNVSTNTNTTTNSKTQTESNANKNTEEKRNSEQQSNVNKNIITKTIVYRTITEHGDNGKITKVTTEHEETSNEDKTTESKNEKINTEIKTSENNTSTTHNETSINKNESKVENTTKTTIEQKGGEINSNRYSSSRFSIAGNLNGKPVLGYDVVKLDSYAIPVTAEVDIKHKELSGVGVAITKTIKKDRYFVGVGYQYKIQEKKGEANLMVGMKF